MSSVNLFSNIPFFCQKPTSTNEILSMTNFNALTQANDATSGSNACSDPNLGAQFRKNVFHQVIRCGGAPIDLNFMEDMFPNSGFSTPKTVNSKVWYNHYICDIDFNIYAQATVTGSGPNQPFTFQLLRANHASGGSTSYPLPGMGIIDKENQITYTVTAVNKTTPYAHLVTVVPNENGVTGQISANKAYFVSPARQVGGCNCSVVTNQMQTIGYTRVNQTIRVRRDWRVCIDLLTGYENMPQFAMIYDVQGNPVDSWDALEAKSMREDIRMALNAAAFIGTPTTNPALINTGTDIGVDPLHTGFYGIIPTIKYGGGNVYNYRSDIGFDMEVDFEPIALYQDSRKRATDLLFLHGLAFAFNLNDRMNKLVDRTGVGSNIWEAYRRIGDAMGTDTTTAVEKLGINAYSYMGFRVDFKRMPSWSDYRYMGSDYFNNMAVVLPRTGVKQNGVEIPPIEFVTTGNGNWTDNYEEHYQDFRVLQDGCRDVGGWAAQSLNMTVHCPGQMILVNPVKGY